jgi:hypothetical protein
MPLKLMQDQLHIEEETIHYILKKDFGKRKMYLKFVPHSLLEEHKENRVTTSEDIIQNFSQLHHYSRRVFGFSANFQNKISEHGVENKIIKA